MLWVEVTATLVATYLSPAYGLPRRSYRPSIRRHIARAATHLDARLVPVMVRLAEGLEIGGVPEETLVALVRRNMVADVGGGDDAFRPAHLAERLAGQLSSPKLAPPLGVIPTSIGVGGITAIVVVAPQLLTWLLE
jgi:hypothetical protein